MPVAAARLELVDIGTPVAVNTPVGIEVVLLDNPDKLCELASEFEDGALLRALEGGAAGRPATVLILAAGVCQFVD